MKVLIIGCSGFIGKNLLEYLEEQKVEVYGATHKEDIEDKSKNSNIYYLDINNINLPKNFTHIIYLSHYNKEDIITFYEKLLNYFKDVRYQYYISSYSAHKNAISNYGILKYKIENIFLNRGHFVISPGLVIGKGGIFYKVATIVKRLPIIFYPNKKNSLMPIISIRALNEVIYKSLQMRYKQKNIVFSQKIPFKKILIEIAKCLNKRRIFIAIDANYILTILYLLDKINFPISSDSLKGFIANQDINIESDLYLFNIKEDIRDYICNL